VFREPGRYMYRPAGRRMRRPESFDEQETSTR
jgi:hypothetical protein